MATKSELAEDYKNKFIQIADELEKHYVIKDVTLVAYGTKSPSVAASYADKRKGVRGVTRAEVMLLQFILNYHKSGGDIRNISCEDSINLQFPTQ